MTNVFLYERVLYYFNYLYEICNCKIFSIATLTYNKVQTTSKRAARKNKVCCGEHEKLKSINPNAFRCYRLDTNANIHPLFTKEGYISNTPITVVGKRILLLSDYGKCHI
jgi:hypothetical protein